MMRLTRRQFLKLTGAAAAGVALFGAGCTAQPTATTGGAPSPSKGRRQPPAPTGDQAYLAVARGSDPAAITKAAIAALGGIERFVQSGDDVIIKPNICVDYHPPEYAATTNPTVVATLVSLCRGAGARRVRVMDTPFGGTPESAYAVSGIEEAVRTAGGEMEVMSPVKFVKTPIPEGRDITEWEVYQDVLEANVLINVPIAKHHSLAGLTLGGKNLLGVILNPSRMHFNLGQRVADLVSLVRPTLTVVDAVRILTAHGPTGGSLNDVQQTDTIIASHDIVAADAYATTLFGLTGASIAYVKAAAEMGLGTMELDSIRIEEISA
ncbi:MAG: cytoplasmic protein [Chloroflexota bacterium]|nr:MAG: cytoplasmic protein [Chloroflexota bacterium]